MFNVHSTTKLFEEEIAKYCGSPYCLAFDNASSAIYLALCYENIRGKEISIPERTYMSAVCEVINAGGIINFEQVEGNTIKGAYNFKPTRVWDSALYFSADMFIPNSLMCLSFTGAYKTFKLSKGGAIILDDLDAYNWIKKARNSGRNDVSYHEDNFTMLGKNSYMMPELAIRGLLLIQQFYNVDNSKKHNEPVELPYPKLSNWDVYKQASVEQRIIKSQEEYIDLLSEEIFSLIEIAHVHGWKSKYVEKGQSLRNKIKELHNKRNFEL